jgi:hypothetical protein
MFFYKYCFFWCFDTNLINYVIPLYGNGKTCELLTSNNNVLLADTLVPAW